MGKILKPVPDISTEEKIKDAARKVFTRKGYSATRTRDIAEEAGLNLALLNYYFRSKQKLFEIVMFEKMQKFFGILLPILFDISTSLETKVESISASYIDLILANPDLPFFILSEIRNDPGVFMKIIQKKDFLKNSVFIRQIKEKKPEINPLHFLISLLGMCVFPFVMKPVLKKMTGMEETAFKQMMLERKSLIPVWVKAMLKVK
ncbi:MAG TPA: helix-turn-helix domain-containing protein [Puia sp.]|jgi:AcrR family transcriptional regulator|nr:helix-turn-helix domain-containing protein [Puia sp.]